MQLIVDKYFYLRNALTLAKKYYKFNSTNKLRVISRASEWLHTLT
ncbi:hypothetical protein HMPREF0555_0517 [Leuconostoc mesenteroides subsp. cremoris ATCC 19254]|uniref:Uncharacterized protein n=1 Tax=Leuconostoc mesenteroides subsp. cremoris ATCC 19254 TaxID=586220 RepID=C2KIQ1_LEUMC|nr:hypothetical protein HMPREF0555_0517 [Leuconostoc mesenteroides subsp. cremoris ATCC 19254]